MYGVSIISCIAFLNFNLYQKVKSLKGYRIGCFSYRLVRRMVHYAEAIEIRISLLVRICLMGNMIALDIHRVDP